MTRRKKRARAARRGASAALFLAALVPAAAAEEVSKPNQAQAGQLRCGWFDNPTPGNASLYDKDGEWTVAVQGGRQATGDWPAFKPAQWVPRGTGSYGLGCACLRVEVDVEEKDVLAILSSEVKPLTTCRRDPALARFERQLK